MCHSISYSFGASMALKNQKSMAAAAVALAIAACYLLIVESTVSILVRAALAILVLGVAGTVIQRSFSFNGGYGLYLLASRKGLSSIDRLSRRNRAFWDALAMWGFVLGFGLASYPLLRGRLDKRVFAFGMLSLVAMFFLIVPYLGEALQFINVPMVQSSASTTVSPQAGLLIYLIDALTFVVGFSGFAITSMAYSGGLILLSVGHFLVAVISGSSNPSGQLSSVPGVVPIIPGIDIPLVAGIAALVVLLTVHELSHGVLSRLSKVRLKSLGLLMFGILPVGAFVEPDERMIKKLDAKRQTSIFAAGIAANFIAMVVFFLLMLVIMVVVAPKVYSYGIVVSSVTPGYPAYNVITPGSQIVQWNAVQVTNVTTLQEAASADAPNSIVTVVTRQGNNLGVYMIKAVPSPENSSRGIIGVGLSYSPIVRGALASFVYFLYTLFALSMLLNFFVAVFNLLPIPGLDGWSIYRVNIKNKRLVRVFTALVLVAIGINALPWLFYL